MSSSIFKGCTVRFAWFCNRRPLLFAPRNSLRAHFFTDCTNLLSETRKRGPRTIQKDSKTLPWSLWKHPENGSKTGHQEKSLFALRTNPGECCLRALDLEMGPRLYIDIYVYMYIYIYICTRESACALRAHVIRRLALPHCDRRCC